MKGEEPGNLYLGLSGWFNRPSVDHESFGGKIFQSEYAEEIKESYYDTLDPVDNKDRSKVGVIFQVENENPDIGCEQNPGRDVTPAPSPERLQKIPVRWVIMFSFHLCDLAKSCTEKPYNHEGHEDHEGFLENELKHVLFKYSS